jgi:hypothetical protein
MEEHYVRLGHVGLGRKYPHRLRLLGAAESQPRPFAHASMSARSQSMQRPASWGQVRKVLNELQAIVG